LSPRAIGAIAAYVDGAPGEISIPVKGDGNCGSVQITRRITINQPTKEKIESTLAVIAAPGFHGNIKMPRAMSDPFVIVIEEYREPGRTLLLENGRDHRSKLYG